MYTPFPGMDPYLEHPALWQDVHDSLVTAIRDVLVPKVAPRYFVGVERRTYLLKPDDIVFVGRPDVAVASPNPTLAPAPVPVADITIFDVDVPMGDEIHENYLEIREVKTGKLVTVLELL